jgi:thioredoxin reductase (NADPH)
VTDPFRVPRPAVIGCGPAGIAAAVQLKRYGLDPLVFEKNLPGGLLKNANLVENYPGFPQGISGLELVRRMAAQLERVGVEVTNEEVTCLDCSAQAPFEIRTPGGVYLASHVVAATGTRPRPFLSFDLPPEVQERVFYEVYPLLRETGRQVVIIGAGDAAFDYALNLAGRGNQVTILNRTRQVGCLPLLWERASASDKIRYFDRTAITGVALDRPGGPLLVHCGEDGRAWDLMADSVLFAIGREPEMSCFSENLLSQRAALERAGLLFFAGDVQNGLFRQTAIAAGDGLRAAMHICQAYDHDKTRSRS